MSSLLILQEEDEFSIPEMNVFEHQENAVILLLFKRTASYYTLLPTWTEQPLSG